MTYYMVMRLMTFSGMNVSSAMPMFMLPKMTLAEPGEGDPKWFVPVFDNIEDARGWADDGKFAIQEIHTTAEA